MVSLSQSLILRALKAVDERLTQDLETLFRMREEVVTKFDAEQLPLANFGPSNLRATSPPPQATKTAEPS